MVLFILCKLILQTRMRSHPVGLDVWFLAGPFVYFHISCVWTATALEKMRGCAGSREPSLVAYVISAIISWAGSNNYYGHSPSSADSGRASSKWSITGKSMCTQYPGTVRVLNWPAWHGVNSCDWAVKHQTFITKTDFQYQGLVLSTGFQEEQVNYIIILLMCFPTKNRRILQTSRNLSYCIWKGE